MQEKKLVSLNVGPKCHLSVEAPFLENNDNNILNYKYSNKCILYSIYILSGKLQLLSEHPNI